MIRCPVFVPFFSVNIRCHKEANDPKCEREERNMGAFDQVIGYEPIKEEMMQVCDMIRNPEVYRKMGAILPRGMILYGEPGLGKTLMAKAFIQESGLPVITVRKSKGKDDVLERIEKAFKDAVKQAPVIVFLDDMDKFANEDHNHCDADEYVAIQAGIDDVKDKKVFVLATANEFNKLPRSLRRCGRFDRQIEFSSPNAEDARKIMEFYLRDKKVDPSINMEDLSKMLDCDSCAVLETVLNEAAIYAAYARKETVCMPDLIRAVMRKAYESPETYRKMTEEEVRKAALHEAGHAVICEVLMPGGVGMVSVRAEGENPGGIMHRCNESITSLQAILIALGGKAATEIYYAGMPAEGCSSDIKKAYQIILKNLDQDAALGFSLTDIEPCGYDSLSQFQRTKMETAVQTELERHLLKAKDILQQYSDFLEKLTEELMQKETLLYSDVQRIKAECNH